jgi:hypothetical protein
MNFENQKSLRKILLKFADGFLNNYQAVKRVNNLFAGLRLDGEEISLECLNCCNEILPFTLDQEVTLIFDPGVPDSRVTPGEPATVHLICEACRYGNTEEEAINDKR